MSTWSTPGGDDHRRPAGSSPPGAPPYGSPYGGPPPSDPHATPYGPTPYAAPYAPHSYGEAPYAVAYGPPGVYGTRPRMTSRWRGATITLIVLSALMTLFAWGLGVPSLVLGIIAMTRAQHDGPSGTRLVKIGWIWLGVVLVLVLAVVAFLLAVRTHGEGPSPVEQI